MTSSLADKDVGDVGDVIGFRGPYGNVFPLEKWKGKSLIFVAGGIALPPLRSVIWNRLDLRDWFTDITVVYGARSVADLVYKNELEDWGKRYVCKEGPVYTLAELEKLPAEYQPLTPAAS